MKLAILLVTYSCVIYCTTGCVREYYELEDAIVNDRSNLDKLTIGFFPPNLQPSLIVEIFYHVNGTPWSEDAFKPRPPPIGCASFTQEPRSSCRAYNNKDKSCVHLFRWSFSSIYLFMGPRLVSDMALNYIPGTEISIRQVHLVIPEICDNSTITVISGIDEEENQWEPRVLLLNKLTTFLRSYAISRRGSTLLGIQPASQGYATFCDARENSANNIVLQHQNLYFENFVATGVSLGALALFTTLAAPILIYQQYGRIYTNARSNSRNFRYFLWSFVSLCAIGDYLLSFLDLFYHIKCYAEPHLDSSYKFIYTIAVAAWAILAIIDLVLASFVVLAARKKDFPSPDLIQCCLTGLFTCCQCWGITDNTYIIQILAVWHVFAALQITCFHAVFIFIGFIAQPLHTALTMIFYTALVFCLLTTFTLLYASFHAGRYYDTLRDRRLNVFCRKTITGIIRIFVLIFFLFTIVFFGFTFLRITVFVGDTESGRIPGFVGSLLPSILIALLGYVAKRQLDSYSDRERSEQAQDHVTTNSNITTHHDIDRTVGSNFILQRRFPSSN